MPVPTAPIISVRPSVTATTLQFWWSPPAQTNGTITNYLLEDVAHSISQSVSATARTATVTSLTVGTDYTFTLKAVNETGTGAPATFHTVRTSAVPQPVSTLTVAESVTGGILTLVFSWTNPADYAYFYTYGLRLATGTKDFIYTGTSDYSTVSYTATNLNPYQAYTFHIQRCNDAAYSATTTLTTTTRPYDPRTVPGLWLWVDANDVSGNGNFVPDGTPVTTWVDKSGTANNTTPIITPATLGTDSLGRYLQFDGSGNFYLSEYILQTELYFTIFIVDTFTQIPYTQDNSDKEWVLIGPSGNAGTFPLLAYVSGNNPMIYTLNQAPITFNYTLQPANVWCLTSYALNNVYLNKQILYTSQYNGPYQFDNSISIGGLSAGNSFSYLGKMREVLIYLGPMLETDRAAISDYLSIKWTPQTPGPTPDSLPVQRGLTQWLDAGDLKTIYQDVSGADNIYGENYYTQLWKDKSGNRNDMVSLLNVSYNIPPAVYNAGIMNGLPGLDFSKGNGSLFASKPLPLNTEITIFIVAIMTPVAGQANSSNLWSHAYGPTEPVIGVTYGTYQIFFSVNSDFYSTQTPFVVNRPGLYVATMSNEQITSFKSFDSSGNIINNVTIYNYQFILMLNYRNYALLLR